MAKTENLVSFCNQENWAEGGFFKPGIYKVKSARFGQYDFNGKAQTPVTCMVLHLIDSEGEELDRAQYYSVGDGFKESRDGKGLIATGDKAKLSKSSNFIHFMDHLAKVYDISQFDNDIAELLDDKTFEFGLVRIESRQSNQKSNVESAEERKQDKPKDKDMVVVVGVTKETSKGGSSKKETGSKKEETKEKGGSKKDDSGDVESDLATYFEEKVCTKANAKGIKTIQARIGIPKFFDGKSNDEIKAITAAFNNQDTQKEMLAMFGWKLSDDEKSFVPED